MTQTLKFLDAEYTKESLGEMTLSQLLDLHNKIATGLGKPTRDKFPDKSTAIARTWGGLLTINGLTQEENKVEKKTAKANLAKAEKAAKKATKKATSKKAAKVPAKKAPAKGTGGRALFGNDDLIKVNVTENQKRANTRAFEKMAILMKFNGKTVKQFLEQEGKNPDLDLEPGWARNEIRWCAKQGWVTIGGAKKAAAPKADKKAEAPAKTDAPAAA